MYLSHEKTLLDKGYVEVDNNDVWCYVKDNRYIYLNYNNETNGYKFVFPLRTGVSYVKYFDMTESDKLRDYVNYIILDYL